MSHSAAIENQNIESSDIKKKKRKRLFSCLAVSIALAGAGSFAWWEFVGSRYVETDNAYTDVESAQLSSAVTGTVSAILVTDSQVVKKGDVLIQLDPTDAQLALNQAEADLNLSIRRVNGYKATDTKLGAEVVANEKEQKRLLAQVDAANADFQRATVDLKRREALMQTGAISGDELTRIQNVYASALANLNAAKAAVAQADAAKQAAVGARQANAVLIENADTETNPEVVLARAKRDQARLDLERTVIRSPVDGVVARRQVELGQRVQPSTPLLSVVPVQQIHVNANFKEVQLQHKVELVSDLYGDNVLFHGTVEGFDGGTGAAFSVIPAQNATGNWIKVVQRLPVRIKLNADELAAHPLRVGLSMKATVNLKSE